MLTLLSDMQEALHAGPGAFPALPGPAVTEAGTGSSPSYFAFSDLASASVAAAGAELAYYCGLASGTAPPAITVDRRLASFWFKTSLRPQGWSLGPQWDAIAGDYPARDGWIRLHTNAPHHRARALQVLGCAEDRAAVSDAVADWLCDELESAIVRAGGAAARMRDISTWRAHLQGIAVANAPLIAWQAQGTCAQRTRPYDPARPLAGVRVLDLTRVLAGPVATRFLAAFGADVLRIDPPDWDEGGNIAEMTPGKRCAGLDLKSPYGRSRLIDLARDADVLVHGYRADALPALGLGGEALRAHNPTLIDVALNAYGWTGPWANRRGFDSLVQMSSGIGAHGMVASGADHPVPLPAQGLDHATGYLMAAAVLRALVIREQSGTVLSARLSLARTAELLIPTARNDLDGPDFAGETDADLAPVIEATDWGPAQRLRFPVAVGDLAARWERPASRLRAAEPVWGSAGNRREP